MIKTTDRLIVLGITPDVDTCECCGKTNLKRTVILGTLDADGDVACHVYYGSRCASLALDLNISARAMEKHAEKIGMDRLKAEFEAGTTVNPEESSERWAIVTHGSNGGSHSLEGYAVGTRKAVEAWADEKYGWRGATIENPRNVTSSRYPNLKRPTF
jgi:hypothetical protein